LKGYIETQANQHVWNAGISQESVQFHRENAGTGFFFPVIQTGPKRLTLRDYSISVADTIQQPSVFSLCDSKEVKSTRENEHVTN
jgi:hypothetical protein